MLCIASLSFTYDAFDVDQGGCDIPAGLLAILDQAVEHRLLPPRYAMLAVQLWAQGQAATLREAWNAYNKGQDVSRLIHMVQDMIPEESKGGKLLGNSLTIFFMDCSWCGGSCAGGEDKYNEEVFDVDTTGAEGGSDISPGDDEDYT